MINLLHTSPRRAAVEREAQRAQIQRARAEAEIATATTRKMMREIKAKLTPEQIADIAATPIYVTAS